jgi:hypothetical protein
VVCLFLSPVYAKGFKVGRQVNTAKEKINVRSQSVTTLSCAVGKLLRSE